MFRSRYGYRQQGLKRELLQTVRQAQALNALGQPGPAAGLLAQAATRLEMGGQLPRAANLRARAAHLYAAAGDERAALAQACQALDAFASGGMSDRQVQFYRRIMEHLAAQNMTAAKAALQQAYGARLGELPAAPQPLQPHGRLPAACPQCSAPVRPDEVEWLDPLTAGCAYCGAVLRAVGG